MAHAAVFHPVRPHPPFRFEAIDLPSSHPFPVIGTMIRSLAPLALLFALASALHAAEPSAKLTELRKQRRELNSEIRKAVPDPEQADPELAKLKRESIQATVAHQKAIDEHPNLKAYKAERDAATAKLTNAIGKGDKEGRQAAQDELTALMQRRMDAASKEPDLRALGEAAGKASDAYNARLKEFHASHPATKEAAAKLAEVEASIAEEMKRQREN